MTTGRPGLAPGERGEPWLTPLPNGGFQARQRVRDRDGRVREVTATKPTRGAALRELQKRVDSRQAPTTFGVSAHMRVDELATYWLEQRTKTGLEAKSGALRPQTLAAYATEVRLIIEPTFGRLRVHEMTVGLLDSVWSDLEKTGISTQQARSVLSQMLALAARHGALPANPMSLVAKPSREPREVEALDLDGVARLRQLVNSPSTTAPGRRPSRNLAEIVDVLLGTGCRIGEVLALRWQDFDLAADLPSARICGTIVEGRKGYVDKQFRQESTKSRSVRTLILPDHVVELLLERRYDTTFAAGADPVFASKNGTWLYASNLRTRLRALRNGDPRLENVTPHTLRRTVGTRIAHEVGLDAVREQLGHSHPSISFQRYVAARELAPDLRSVLDAFFTQPGA